MTKYLRKYRIIILILFLLTLYLIGHIWGVADWGMRDIKDYVKKSGYWGFVIFVCIFSAGEFVHIPGVLFIGTGILAYGKVIGFFLGFFGALSSLSFSFITVRLIGGKALQRIDRPFFNKLLTKLDSKPIRIIIVLRFILTCFPPLNYTLALSNVRYRDYLIGSAIGLLVPVALMAVFFDWVFSKLNLL